MKMTPTLIIFASIFLFGRVSMAMDDVADGVDLTTIKAPWTVRILGNNLDISNVQAKPDEQSAYFMMSSDTTKLNVSVFIEPVGTCNSGEECRDHVLSAGNPAWGKFEGLAKGKLRDFSYFEFYRPEVRGQPLRMLDMYAEYVSQGYWVDLHISKTLYTKEDHGLFEKVINSINFIPRTGAAKGAFDTQLAKGLTSVTAWLGLWDKMKCRESYTVLSPLTRVDNSETSWIDYCTKVNTALGANRSRNVIAAAFTRSLPPKTDRPVAVVAYHSNFAGRPSIVEIIGLLQEPNGSWTITNYLPQ